MPVFSVQLSTSTVLRTATHEPGSGRACFHLLEWPPPEQLTFDAAAVARLNWQPIICGNVIASRIGSVVTLAFDYLGAIHGFGGHYPKSGQLDSACAWRYQLLPEAGGTMAAERID